MTSGTVTEALICQDVHWVSTPATNCELPLVEMEKGSLYHANCP